MASLDGSKIIMTLQVGEDGTPTAAGDASESTQQEILAELQTPVESVPHEALDATTDLSHSYSTSSASGEVSLVAATASQTTRVHRMVISAAGATTIELRNGASGTALRTIEFPAAGAYVFDFSSRPYLVTTANTALMRNSSAAVKVTVELDYVKSA
jgi:hypothetical protein